MKLEELHRVHLAKTRMPAGTAGTFALKDVIIVRITMRGAHALVDDSELPVSAMFLNDQRCRLMGSPLGTDVAMLCPTPPAGSLATLWVSPPIASPMKSSDIPQWMADARKSGMLLDLSSTLAAAPVETFANEDAMISRLFSTPKPEGKP